MSDSIFEINRKHGLTMYRLGLEHAIEIIKLTGEDALENLEKKLAEEKAREEE